jgi:hypothetical protein
MKNRRYRVRYARLVVMEVEVLATPSRANPDEPEEYLDDGRLPGVFSGIDERKIGEHVVDVQDYEHVWEVELVAEQAA